MDQGEYTTRAHLLRVTAPHFCAGAVWRDGRCIRAAPILNWMRYRSPTDVRDYLNRKGWEWEWVSESSTNIARSPSVELDP